MIVSDDPRKVCEAPVASAKQKKMVNSVPTAFHFTPAHRVELLRAELLSVKEVSPPTTHRARKGCAVTGRGKKGPKNSSRKPRNTQSGRDRGRGRHTDRQTGKQ